MRRYAGLMPVFIMTLPLIAFGVPLGNKTITLSFLVLFVMMLGMIARNVTVVIDDLLVILATFITVAAVSCGLSAFVLQGQHLYVMGENIHVKEITQLSMLAFAAAHLVVLCSAMSSCSPASINRMLKLFMAVSAIVAVYALYQYAAFLYDLPFSDILRNTNSYSLLKGKETSSWVGLPRVRAFMPEPSFLGVYLLMPISFAIPAIGMPGQVKTKVFFLLYFAALVLSFSRSSWFILAAVAAYYVLREFVAKSQSLRKILTFVGVVILTAILFYLLVPEVSDMFDRLTAFSDRSAVERVRIQKAAFTKIAEHPWLGIGWGNTPWVTGAQVTHNFYLQLLLETGIVGLAVFLTFLALLWKRLNYLDRLIKRNISLKQYSATALGLRLAFLSIIGMWFNLPAYNFSYTWFVFAVISVFPAILTKSVNDESLAANKT